MKIEEMTLEKLSKVSDKELYSLRLRFIQLFNKWFRNNSSQKVGNLKRDSFLDKYGLLLKEMNKRKLYHSVQSIDGALFRKNLYRLNVGDLDELLLVPDYISIVGSQVSDPKNEKSDIDILIRDSEDNRDSSNELLVVRAIRKALGYDKKK